MEANPQKTLTEISGSKVSARERSALTGGLMSWEVITGLIAFVSLWYLTYVLLRPHKLR